MEYTNAIGKQQDTCVTWALCCLDAGAVTLRVMLQTGLRSSVEKKASTSVCVRRTAAPHTRGLRVLCLCAHRYMRACM